VLLASPDLVLKLHLHLLSELGANLRLNSTTWAEKFFERLREVASRFFILSVCARRRPAFAQAIMAPVICCCFSSMLKYLVEH
jgi:hypothetical protein